MDDTTKELFISIINETIRNGKSIMIWDLDTLQQCQFVVTGCIQGTTDFMPRIGYVVQVRLKEDYYDSEVYIRCADSIINVHSNQSYYIVSDENVITLMKYFDVLPSHDLLNKEGYTYRGEDLELDFIVRN